MASPNQVRKGNAEGHDSCGVGVVADTNGAASRRIVALGLGALASVEHRGGVAADGRTSDGAGVKTQIPQAFFKKIYESLSGKTAGEADIAAGNFFLPRDEDLRGECRALIARELEKAGFRDFIWRDTPVNEEVLGVLAARTRPHMAQLLIKMNGGPQESDPERALYALRRAIEKQAQDAGLSGEGVNSFYIASLSADSIVYKGLSLAADVGRLYPDLQDPLYESAYLIFHRRFSTNTAPAWHRAHPYRYLAHNGEINTLAGNVNAMPVLEALLKPRFGERAGDICPVIDPDGSDSAMLDNAIEFLVHAGYSLPAIKSLLVPEAILPGDAIPDDIRAMYEYGAMISPPWDGPAMLVMADHEMVMAGGDRNGLRPTHYLVTNDGLFVAGSEDGMAAIDEKTIVRRENLRPGEMIGVDLKRGGLLSDQALKSRAASEVVDQEALAKVKNFPAVPAAVSDYSFMRDSHDLTLRQRLSGMTQEDIAGILDPMALDGREALGSMGDDSQLAVFAKKYLPLPRFFKQRFAQVTNPPIDPIREKAFTSLITHIGAAYDSQGRVAGAPVIRLKSPVLLNGDYARIEKETEGRMAVVDCTFDPDGAEDEMGMALQTICSAAEEAARNGKIIVLTHENIGAEKAPVPMMLATSAVHAHLIEKGLRGFTSLVARPCDCRDTHDFACIVGMGADAVNAFMAEETIAARHGQEVFDLQTGAMKKRYGDMTLETCLSNYKKANEDGLLKVMSKMGIAPVASYRGARLFEAIGLSRDVMIRYFPGVPSVAGGIGMEEIQRRIVAHHRKSIETPAQAPLPIGGHAAIRKEGEIHAYQSEHIHLLQEAINHPDAEEGYKIYRRYAAAILKSHDENPVHLRDLLAFENPYDAISVDETEPVEEIVRRFATGAMSHGSISQEAHEALALAMNRLGGKSNSGEGGEDPARDGTEKGSAIRQIASGRFDVSARYMTADNVRELQIKIAQGAKPGEGGQLMGFKVVGDIAKLRHCREGTTLISPPPHHDIYSIEDLAQLIHDLKEMNPGAKVSVKLVASHGVDTIAVGVVKAGADAVHISGGNGGTGASPQSSIHHAGMPWETALSAVQRALSESGFRDKVTLSTDGSLRSGRDIVTAALLGAEEYGFGLHALVALGCRLMRQCHTGKCAFGIATQDEKLRKENFRGTVDGVMNMMRFIAMDVRENLAALGLHSLDEAVGRADFLRQVKGHDFGIDLDPLLISSGSVKPYEAARARSEYKNPSNPDYISVDQRLLNAHGDIILAGKSGNYALNVTNQDRDIGTRLSGALCRKFGEAGLPVDHITLSLKGVAGQSLGFGAIQGVTIDLQGAANDGVGKALSGGTIVVRPDPESPLHGNAHENTIIGNSCLYGATNGALFAAGLAGNRFAVRLSGATAIVEGTDDNACEYMTNGTVVVLGSAGRNFGAGMSGGEAFIYDPENILIEKANKDIQEKIGDLCDEGAKNRLKMLVTLHREKTGSKLAESLLRDWDQAIRHFRHVDPARKPANDPAEKSAVKAMRPGGGR